MRFDSVLVMGANKIAWDCTALLAGKAGKECVFVLETADTPISMLAKLCRKQGIAYRRIVSRADIDAWLKSFVKDRKVLIVSANNRYIFRPGLIAKPGIEIINFHYALLPHYRGINIPAWVIYNGEQMTGITWHYVTEEIDHGKIISQRSIEITGQTTAFDITKRGMELARDSFCTFFEVLLEQEIPGTEVVYPEDSRVYLARELPGNGYLDMDLPAEGISRTLRAYDHHGAGIFPKLKVRYCGADHYVDKYVISRESQKSFARKWSYSEGILRLCENDSSIRIWIRRM